MPAISLEIGICPRCQGVAEVSHPCGCPDSKAPPPCREHSTPCVAVQMRNDELRADVARLQTENECQRSHGFLSAVRASGVTVTAPTHADDSFKVENTLAAQLRLDLAREVELRIKDGEACNAAAAKWDAERKELKTQNSLLQFQIDNLSDSMRQVGEYVIDLRREAVDAKKPIVLGPDRHKDIVPVLEHMRVAIRTALSRIDTNHGSFAPMVEVANSITALFAALPGKQDSKGGTA